MTTSGELALRRAIDAVQSIADPVPPWADILSSTKDLIGGESATFIVFEGRKLATFEQIDVDRVAHAAYVDHYCAQDIMLSSENPRAPGTWLNTEDALTPVERGRNAYYVDFMCRHRMRQMVSFVIEESPLRASSMTVQRDLVRDDVAQQVAGAPMRLFSAALLSAVAQRRERASQWLDAVESASAGFKEATFLVTGNGVVLRMSPNAQDVLDDGPGLLLRHGCLWHPDAKLRDALRRALGSAARPGSQPCHLSLRGRSGMVHRLELARAHAQLRLGDEALVFLRMYRQRAPCGTRLDTLCLAFDLTPAEARVLAALADGQTPIGHAQAQGVSINTVRKQISTLMQKMDCTRQADLVRMALAVS
ncbi:MAG TPA: helix-turn-helix transcriptional regulator [Ramlibacter sp.]|nr:helix-turn-helix transcriptional regulator [Ramlibacter sp.]